MRSSLYLSLSRLFSGSSFRTHAEHRQHQQTLLRTQLGARVDHVFESPPLLVLYSALASSLLVLSLVAPSLTDSQPAKWRFLENRTAVYNYCLATLDVSLLSYSKFYIFSEVRTSLSEMINSNKN